MTDRITQIKNYFSIAEMVAPYTGGLSPPVQTGYGQYYNGWCPFCQHGTKQKGQAKRFWVNIKTGICNCFRPTCAAPLPMDVINFWSKLHDISNDQAIRDLSLMMPTKAGER